VDLVLKTERIKIKKKKKKRKLFEAGEMAQWLGALAAPESSV